MNKKTGVLILVLLILVFGGVLYYFLSPSPSTYSSNPADWVIEEEGKLTVDVFEATEGNSQILGASQQYVDYEQGITTAFELSGLYKGELFKNEYLDDEVLVMRINPEMDPSDGIIEGFIIEKIEDVSTKKVIAYVFVDKDWKNQISNTNILWGASYQNTKTFEFKEIKPGIYMDTITDDANRFLSDDFKSTKGGVAVGDMTLEDVNSGNTDGITLIRLV